MRQNISSILMSLAIFAMTMAGSAIMARWANPELFGAYLAFLSSAGIATAVFNFGMTEISLREVSRAYSAGANRQQVLAALARCFAIQGFTVLPAVGLSAMLAFISLEPEQAWSIIALVLAQTLVMGSVQIGGCVLRGAGAPIWGQVAGGFTPYTVIMIVSYLLWGSGIEASLHLMCLVAVCGGLTGSLAVTVKTLSLLNHLPAERGSYRPMQTRKLARMAMPVAASVGVNIANVHVNAISLAFFHGALTVSYFQISMQINMIFPIIFAQLSMIGVANLMRARTHRAELAVIRSMMICALSAATIIGGIYLAFPEEATRLILGKSTETLSNTFIICVLASVIPALSIAAQPYLIAQGRTGDLLKAALCAALSNIGLSLLLGRSYGALGAAYGLLASNLIMSSMIFFFAYGAYRAARAVRLTSPGHKMATGQALAA